VPMEIMRKLQQWCAEKAELNAIIDSAAFLQALNKDEQLVTNIPMGYGLGSSGAVVAAIYDRFKKKDVADLDVLKELLGGMEAIFHGKSSGLDPLVSFLNKAVLISEGKTETQPVRNTLKFELYDTEISRSTAHLVETFMERTKDEAYNNLIREVYIPMSNECIAMWQEGNRTALLDKLKSLSAFQLEYFNFAIPTNMQKAWERSLSEGTHIYKLCGAGGGGYMLSFPKNQ
jgi:mevalonate kinase